MQARSINEYDLHSVGRIDGEDAMTRRLRLRGYYADLRPHDSIDQCRLADIRPANACPSFLSAAEQLHQHALCCLLFGIPARRARACRYDIRIGNAAFDFKLLAMRFP